jgi:uncharacterized protein
MQYTPDHRNLDDVKTLGNALHAIMLPQAEPLDKGCCPRLLVDAMLGSLAKRLRWLGYDAVYWRDGSDEALMARARTDGRLIVTRDHALARRRGVAALLVESESLAEQFAEVHAALPIPPQPFTRCGECNGLLETLDREAARALVPPYVWQTQHEFWRCPDCSRAYWKGTHWPSLLAELEELK